MLLYLRDGSTTGSQGRICYWISGTDLLLYLRDGSATVSQGRICYCISGTDLLLYLRDGFATVSQGRICYCTSGTDLLLYLRDGSTTVSQGRICSDNCATLRQKLEILFFFFFFNSKLTPGRSVPALTLSCQLRGRVTIRAHPLAFVVFARKRDTHSMRGSMRGAAEG